MKLMVDLSKGNVLGSGAQEMLGNSSVAKLHVDFRDFYYYLIYYLHSMLSRSRCISHRRPN